MRDRDRARILTTLPSPPSTFREVWTNANEDRGPTRHFWKMNGDTVEVVSFWIAGGELQCAVKTREATDADR